MKTLKKIMVALIVCLMITATVPAQFNFSVLTAEAHGGRTDANGGHKDNKNISGLGYYHYHCGGNPPHLHEQGVCPYTIISTPTTQPSSNTSAIASSDTTSNNVSNDDNSIQTIVSDNNTTALSVTISDTSYDTVAFNASYYASTNNDVYNVYGDDAKALYDHFISSGIEEGRQSSEQFSIFVYRDNNQDLAEAFGDDLIKYYNHFIEHGINENRVSK